MIVYLGAGPYSNISILTRMIDKVAFSTYFWSPNFTK